MEELLLLIEKPKVFVYKIPTEVRGQGQIEIHGEILHQTADWGYPQWNGRLFVYKAKSECCHVELREEDGISIYRKTIIEDYPGQDLKLAADSTLFFTMNVRSANGYSELIGLGFPSTDDSAEVHFAIKDYFNLVNNQRRFRMKTELSEKLLSPVKPIQTQDVHAEDENKKESMDSMRTEGSSLTVVKVEDIPNARIESAVVPGKNDGSENMSGTEGNSLQGAIVQLTTEMECYEGTFLDPGREKKQVEIQKDNTITNTHAEDVQHERQSVCNWKLENFVIILKCSFCRQEFQCKDDLIQHFQDNHARENPKPPENLELEANPTPAQIYARTSDPDYTCVAGHGFFCPVCKLTLNQASQMTHHWSSSHNLQETSICECGLPFAFKKQIRAHQRKFHPVFCAVCGKIFDKRANADEHTLTRHLCDPSGKSIHSPGPGEFSCRLCTGWFSFQSYEWTHCGNSEGHRPKTLTPRDEPIAIPQGYFACGWCKKNFSAVGRIRHHYLTNHPVESECLVEGTATARITPKRCTAFACPGCENVAKTKLDLKYHLKAVHNYSRKNAYNFVSSNDSEILISENAIFMPPQFTCLLCGKTCGSPKGMRKHYGQAHPAVPVPFMKPRKSRRKKLERCKQTKVTLSFPCRCSDCGREFGARSCIRTVREHLQGPRHLGVIFKRNSKSAAFVCYKCSLEFAAKGKYLDHLISSSCSMLVQHHGFNAETNVSISEELDEIIMEMTAENGETNRSH